MNKRVVITGIGAVTPLGNDAHTSWEQIKRGVSGIAPATLFDVEKVDVKIAAEVKGFAPEEFMDKKKPEGWVVIASLLLQQVKWLLRMLGFKLERGYNQNESEFGLIRIGGLAEFEEQHRKFIEKGQRRVNPFTIPMFIPDMAAGQVSISLGAKGINNCSVTACASGANSIGDAFRVIQKGDVDVMIAGGTEATITGMTVAGFSNMTALSKIQITPQRADL